MKLKYLAWISILILLTNYTTALTTTQNLPSTYTNATAGWTNPTYVYNAEGATGNASKITDYYGFGFTLSNNITVIGIGIEFFTNASSSTGTNAIELKVSNDSGTTWSTSYSSADINTTSVRWNTTNPLSNLWGLGWTNASINNIRVRLVSNATTTRTMNVDYLKVQVNYTETSPPAAPDYTLQDCSGNERNITNNAAIYDQLGYYNYSTGTLNATYVNLSQDYTISFFYKKNNKGVNHNVFGDGSSLIRITDTVFTHWLDASSTSCGAYTTTSINDTNWHHYIITARRYNATISNRSYYIDGVQVSNGTCPLTWYPNFETGNYMLKLGSYTTPTLNGSIEEFKAYNISLSVSEAISLYSNSTPNQTSLLRYYKFDNTTVCFAAANTCTYDGTGNWLIKASDNCVISTATTIQTGFNITVNETGNLTINATVNGFKMYIMPLTLPLKFLSGGRLG
jgi:hypothetical protein